jgi:hypothetical protein
MKSYSNIPGLVNHLENSTNLKVKSLLAINGIKVVARNKRRRVVFMLTAMLNPGTTEYTVNTITNRSDGEMWSAASGVTVEAEKLEEYVAGQIKYVIKMQNETK